MDDSRRKFWMDMRQSLLMQVDAIERMLGISRTADLRRQSKTLTIENHKQGRIEKTPTKE